MSTSFSDKLTCNKRLVQDDQYWNEYYFATFSIWIILRRKGKWCEQWRSSYRYSLTYNNNSRTIRLCSFTVVWWSQRHFKVCYIYTKKISANFFHKKQSFDLLSLTLFKVNRNLRVNVSKASCLKLKKDKSLRIHKDMISINTFQFYDRYNTQRTYIDWIFLHLIFQRY